jgi:hypothetical protein
MTDQATDNTPDPKAVEAATVEETPDPTPDTAPSAADPSGDITESAPGETAESPESGQRDPDPTDAPGTGTGETAPDSADGDLDLAPADDDADTPVHRFRIIHEDYRHGIARILRLGEELAGTAEACIEFLSQFVTKP